MVCNGLRDAVMSNLDINSKKALVVDIDGTLLNSKKEITPATAEAIRQVLLAGHEVVIASGRPLPGMRKCGRELQLKEYGGYLLSYNGAKVINCKNEEVIFEKTLPANIPAEIYEYAKAHGAGVVSFEGDCVISGFEPNEYVKLEAKHNGLDIKVIDNFPEYIDFPVNKCMIMDEGDKDALYEKELLEKYGDSLSIYRSEVYFLEIMHAGISKSETLDAILPVLGVKRENTICCGDSYNDISMIEYAGVGVAMGNAKPEVKSVADYITATNDEDGLVEVINKFILNGEDNE